MTDDTVISGRRLLWGAASVTGVLFLSVLFAFFVATGREGDSLAPSQWRRASSEIARQRAAIVGRGAAAPAPASPAPLGDGDRRDDPPPRRPAPILPDPEQLGAQLAEYDAPRAKSILALQRWRTAREVPLRDAAGLRGTARLIDLNPWIDHWYVLELAWEGRAPLSFHLANGRPEQQSLRLSTDYPDGLLLVSTAGASRCPLWAAGSPSALEEAAGQSSPYVLLCDGRVVLRRQATGQKSALERVTDFLRDYVPGGEQVTVFVRTTFYRDAFLETATPSTGPAAATLEQGPPRARVDPSVEGKGVTPAGLGLPLAADVPLLQLGGWYALRGQSGMFLSAMRPDAVDDEIVRSYREHVGPIDDVEAGALVYLVAFDLARFEVAFAMGTDHPRLGWSERVPEERRVAGLPGPDGIDSRAPLVSTGTVPPYELPRVAAAFTAGFKRSHGAFRYGELAFRNNGSHYGMIESGTVFSKLNPGLSTLYVLDDGTVDLKTWQESDDALLPRVVHARQNGVPILERGPVPGTAIPGADLMRFGAGNWSGSQEGRYRTLRAGACLLEGPRARFLVYGYFTSATPSAMARVFQAYGCSYAMLLDMNALEHTYLAVYGTGPGETLSVSHLIDEMQVLDREEDGAVLPRFLAFADNRDFFYLLRKPAIEEGDS